MSEEKLYAVKNDEGKYWDFNGNRNFGRVENNHSTAIASKKLATIVSNLNGGHVVTFVEEPKKVVLSEKQAKIVEGAKKSNYPASYISDQSYDEELLVNALVNGYTVAKEKKYLVYKELGGKQKNKQVAQAYRSSVYPGTVSWILTNEVTNRSFAQFIESEIEQYSLQDCEKKEVTDDGIR